MRALVVAGLLSLVVATVPADAQAPHGQTRSAPTAAPASRVSIDASSKASVTAAWTRLVEPGLEVGYGWNGSFQACRAGRSSARAMQTVRDSTNFIRGLVGLDPIGVSERWSAKAQQAALVMGANNSLSHYVPRNWRCYSKAAADGALHSNIGYGSITASSLVSWYMADPGTTNRAVGHRRWLMNPAATRFGFGLTSSSSAIWVVPKGAAPKRYAKPRWMGWPSAGWFPVQMQPDGRWSLSSASGVDFRKARVSVTRDGERLRVHRHRPSAGPVMPTLVWQVKGARSTGTYRVRVTGLRDRGHRGTFAHTYDVIMFDPGAPAP